MKRLQAATHRLNFYCEWYRDMNETDRFGFIGAWVLDRITLLTAALIKIHSEIGRSTAPNVGNYKAA